MQGIFQKENTDKALKYGIYRHLPTYEKIIRNLVSFYTKKDNDALREYHQKLPHFYAENGGSMEDEELDELIYGYCIEQTA